MAGTNPPIGRAADIIAQQLVPLIRRYAQTRSAQIAHAVVRHIDMLRDHPAFDGRADGRCAYLRMRSHWRLLAATSESRGG
ncbi:MAG: hypothetical protein KDI88_06820 [Gammaproteobacteria bacterium]|nr:hypothetical protein [Gammaproteobacteria bacterium]